LAIKKITRRWLFNSFGVIVVIILTVLVAAGFGIHSYYYGSVTQSLQSRAELADAVFTGFAEDRAADYEIQVRDYVAAFPLKNRMEMMVMNISGGIEHTSSGFVPDGHHDISDFILATESEDRTGLHIGQLGGERVMAFSMFLYLPQTDNISAVRFMVSMTGVDTQIFMLITAVGLLGVAILLLVLFSSSYFIGTIVNPVGLVGETARKIAGGDFRARLQRKTDDEIGELCDIINYMAEELSTAETLKNDFISSVSHELRTPLTAIQGWGETILSDDGTDKETLQRGMKIIINESDRLSGMVEELLDFSRMQSGRLKLVLSKTDAIAELSEAVMMYDQRAKREGIKLIYNEPGGFAPVWGDKNKLRQVFVNIIDNAIKYSDQGATVTVTAGIGSEDLIIQVTDTGIGISGDDLQKVKTKFYKADFTRRGSGIGLAVADEIITRHNGTLEMVSDFGKGTTVIITLPITKKIGGSSEIDGGLVEN
jgi:signal transduction histidine kinase